MKMLSTTDKNAVNARNFDNRMTNLNIEKNINAQKQLSNSNLRCKYGIEKGYYLNLATNFKCSYQSEITMGAEE